MFISLLWKTEKNGEDGVLYYYAAGTHPVTAMATSGYNLSKIVYTGDAKVYENLPSLDAEDKYKPTTLQYVDFSSGWYMPEIFGNVLMYANAEAIGSNSYNYIYATSLDENTIKANNAADEAVYELIDEKTDKDSIKAAMKYYYRTGKDDLVKEWYEEKGLYTEEEYNVFKEFVAEHPATQKAVISSVGNYDKVVKADDVTAMQEDWESTLPAEVVVTTEESGLPTWAICLIIAGSVIVVAAAVLIPIIILSKKKAAREQAEAVKNAYKRPKIDTTDDKSIDVYADDEAEEVAVEEATEAPAEAEAVEETPAEEVVEATAEEVAEAPVEE